MKVMVGLVIIILMIFMANLFWPSNQINDRKLSAIEKSLEKSESIERTLNKDIILSTNLNAPSDDVKIKLMKAEYLILQKDRKNLKRRLSRLKHDMWGLSFDPEMAKKMSEIMLNAYKLIKNPNMLGAFSSVKEIQDEIAKIKFAKNAIKQVRELIEDNQKSTAVTD